MSDQKWPIFHQPSARCRRLRGPVIQKFHFPSCFAWDLPSNNSTFSLISSLSIIYRVLYIPGGCLGFLPSPVACPYKKQMAITLILFEVNDPRMMLEHYFNCPHAGVPYLPLEAFRWLHGWRWMTHPGNSSTKSSMRCIFAEQAVGGCNVAI